MSIIYMESGTDATSDLKFWSQAIGSVSSSTAQARTGPRSVRIATAGDEVRINNVLNDAGRRISFAIYVSSLPGSTQLFAYAVETGDGNVIRVVLTSGGVLQLQGSGAAQIGSDGPVVSTGTWTRLTLSYTITNSSVNHIKLYKDGTLGIDVTNASLGNSVALHFRLFAPTNDFFIDDVYIDDTSDLSDTGDIHVTAKLPSSNNVNQFTTNIGANPANRWTNVNERALSETNGWLDAVNADRENYGIEAQSSGDVNLTGVTLVGRCAWIWAKATTGGLGSPKITNNGTDVAITLLSTSKLFTDIVTSSTYPSASDTIGMVSAGTLDTTSFYECGMLIAYTPAAAAGTTYPQLERGRRGINRGILIGTS